MHSLELLKPDGRSLTLYARPPLPRPAKRRAPFASRCRARRTCAGIRCAASGSTYAAHRQDRTFQPPPEYDPLPPTEDPARPTELPPATGTSRCSTTAFPRSAAEARDRARAHVATAPAEAHCEVVVYTPDRAGSLGALALDHLELLLEVWADRTRRLGARDDVRYVFPFENRGAEVGATLHHPHGQIYAYPVSRRCRRDAGAGARASRRARPRRCSRR